jgi:DNA invertase Pin-like site-specific DNA recombinase
VSANRFVAYYRVSTDEQGRSGLGPEAQHAAVEVHVAGSRGRVCADVEIESGRRRDRPQLAAALAAARAHRVVLVIAKLDRLARNVHFMSGLMESGVEFVATDMPTVNRLTVHILAAVAEEEARVISARTKAALAAAEARGVRLGNPNLHAGSPEQACAANAVKIGRAQMRAADVLPFIEQARRAGATTLQQLADALAARGVPAPSGRGQRLAPSAGGPHRWAVSDGNRHTRRGAYGKRGVSLPPLAENRVASAHVV